MLCWIIFISSVIFKFLLIINLLFDPQFQHLQFSKCSVCLRMSNQSIDEILKHHRGWVRCHARFVSLKGGNKTAFFFFLLANGKRSLYIHVIKKELDAVSCDSNLIELLIKWHIYVYKSVNTVNGAVLPEK